MQNNKVQQSVEETIQSLDNVRRAEAGPFLITRIVSGIKMQNQDPNIWAVVASYISRPGIAIAGLTLLLLLNIGIILTGNKASSATESVAIRFADGDEFVANTISLYDVEKPEP